MKLIVALVILICTFITSPMAGQQSIQISTDYGIYNANGSPDGGYSIGLDLQYARHIHKNWKLLGGMQYLRIEELNDYLASSYNPTFKFDNETYTDIIVGRSWDDYYSSIIGNIGLSYHYKSFFVLNSIGYGIASLRRELNYYARPELEEAFRLGEFSFTDTYNDVGVVVYTARIGYDYPVNENWSLGVNFSFRHVDGQDAHVIDRSNEENLDWSSLRITPEGKHEEFDVMYLFGGVSLEYSW